MPYNRPVNFMSNRAQESGGFYQEFKLLNTWMINTLQFFVFAKLMQKYLYTRKLKYEHFTPAFLLQNNLCEFIAQEH